MLDTLYGSMSTSGLNQLDALLSSDNLMSKAVEEDWMVLV